MRVWSRWKLSIPYFALGFLVVLLPGLGWLPWAGLAVLTGIRIARGPIVRPLAYAMGGASVYALLLGPLFLGPVISEYRHRQDFEPAAWRRNDGANSSWPARLTMIDDLMARHALRGLSRDSVEQLLGPRDSTDYFREWDLVYWLGPERGLMRLDSEWLVLDLGPDGRVSAYEIVRD